jgi:hypothetical protein
MAPLERYTMHGTSVLRLFWRRRQCFSSAHLTQQLTCLSIYLDYLRVLLTGSNSRTLPPGNTISATSILLLVTETSLCPCMQIRANAGCIQLLVQYSSSTHHQSLSLLPFPTSIHLSPINDMSPRPHLWNPAITISIVSWRLQAPTGRSTTSLSLGSCRSRTPPDYTSQ